MYAVIRVIRRKYASTTNKSRLVCQVDLYFS